MAEEANALHAEEMEQLRAHYESTLDDAAIAKEEMEVEMELASSRWEASGGGRDGRWRARIPLMCTGLTALSRLVRRWKRRGSRRRWRP